MEIIKLKPNSELWHKTIDFAAVCSWRAGPNLAQNMKDGVFSDWQGVFAAVESGKIAGFCTFAADDYIPDCEYSPWIGYVFVSEEYRGNRLSGRMISAVMKYAKSLNFDKVYICTGEQGLYEKYGFEKIDRRKTYGGDHEDILVKSYE